MLFVSSIYGQAGAWKSIEKQNIVVGPSEVVEYIEEYTSFQLDRSFFSSHLENAPLEFSGKKGLKTSIPMPDGHLQTVFVYRSKIMEDGLAEKYPDIKNYKFASEDKSISGRFAISQIGFTASVSSPEGKIYIDRYSDESKDFYVSYLTKNYIKEAGKSLACGVSSEDNDAFLEAFNFENSPIPSGNLKAPEGEVTLRTYRIAIATTGEFSQQKGGNADDILALLNESVTKLNEIFESEVSIRFLLIEDNDKIIHLNPNTDPYSNANQGAMLIGQNTTAIGNIIPFNDWDIGHVYTSGCSDVGGIAALQSVCGPNKGNGVTCHYSNNIDIITTRVAAHEIGHQFGATHSFNHCDGENESSGSGYEPGSGQTIMSYAGGCFTDDGTSLNVASGPFIYFHGINIEQMITFSQEGNGNTCADYISTGNTYPQVSLDYPESVYYIPLETPFQLTGSVVDAEDSNITYSWEEFDLGPLSLLGQPILDAPQFVSEVPNETPRRILPELPKILTGIYDNLEVMPFFEKDMTWRLTVRDNNGEAGGADWAETRFIATETAGPFEVLYPNTPIQFTAGTQDTIKWDVANTDGDLVNCKYVNILLSEDGGLTYPHSLAINTPNDGSEVVFIPNAVSNTVRVWIEAADNIFLDISNANSTILEAAEATFTATAIPSYQEICLPDMASIQINTDQFLGFDEEISLEVISGLPEGASYSFSPSTVQPGESSELTIDASNVVSSSAYDIVVRATTESREIDIVSTIELVSGDFSDLAILSPESGESGVEILKTFTWVEDTDADSYTFELSNNPDFTTGSILVKETGLTEESYTLEQPIDRNAVYFWKVTGINRCGDSFTTPVAAFAAEALTCKDYAENEIPVNLPSSGTPTTILESVLVANGQVSDVNVTLLKGTHSNFKDLRVSLKSPQGTTVSLFDKRCAGATSFNVAFDSDSPADIQCPMLNSAKYKPEGDLSIFNGEDLIGTWELIIEDLVSGNGGKVDEYILNICSNVALGEAPILDRNNQLNIAPGEAELINDGRLRVLDGDNDNDELTYTLVEVPQYGELRLSGVTLTVGQTFTQEDLNNNYISYKHTDSSTDPQDDAFVFVVDDSEGGWINLTTFTIDINLVNSVENEFAYDVNIYPNPSNGQFIIDVLDSKSSAVTIEIVDVLGQVITRERRTSGNKMSFDLTNQPKGTYFVKLEIENSYKIYKINVQ